MHVLDQVTLDGESVNGLNIRWLRQVTAVVSQEPVLFDATIEQNVRYGRDDVTQADIERACQQANAHAFIRELPKVTATFEMDPRVLCEQRDTKALSKETTSENPA